MLRAPFPHEEPHLQASLYSRRKAPQIARTSPQSQPDVSPILPGINLYNTQSHPIVYG